MKFGFYGNANNYPFMLARAMRCLGHEVLFLVASREPLNRPENRYSDFLVPYPPWISDVSGAQRWLVLLAGPARARVVRLLNTCDFVFLNEEGPALARFLRVPHAVVLTGSDLEVFANPALASTLKPQLFTHPAWLRALGARLFPDWLLHRWLVQPQRKGIATAAFVAVVAKGLAPRGDQILAEIGVRDAQRHSMQMTDLRLITPVPPPLNPTLRIFCATRLTWKAEPGSDLTSTDYKGSDVMIQGLALFRAQSPAPPSIHLVRKGRHVDDTVALATSLGLDGCIVWHEEMTQGRVIEEYRQADVVIEQLAGSFIGMAGLDAMATGRPLIANGRPEIFEPLLGERSPICQATTPEEVCAHLVRLAASPSLRAEIGAASRRYVERHFSSDAAAARLVRRIANAGIT